MAIFICSFSGFLFIYLFIFFWCYGVILQSIPFSSAINMLYAVEGAPFKSVILYSLHVQTLN